MHAQPPAGMIPEMATLRIRRYTLVPGPPEQRDGAAKPIRRFHLARVAVSPRSELGEDRHERMEAVAERDGQRRDARGASVALFG